MLLLTFPLFLMALVLILPSIAPQIFLNVAAVLLALAFDLIPTLKVRFDKWTPISKRWFMISLIALGVGGSYGLSQVGVLDWFALGWDGVPGAVYVFVLAVLANQGIHGPVAKYQRDKAEREAVG